MGFVEGGKILLHGPPGTGKTSIVKALAREHDLPLLLLNVTNVVHHYLGKTGKNVRSAFEEVKQFQQPAIFFLDEIDALAKSRTSDEHAALKRAIITFNLELDKTSLTENKLIVIGATNHPEVLDKAIWSRFDKVIEFPIPENAYIRTNILETNINYVRQVSDKIKVNVTNIDELGKLTKGFTGRDLRKIVRIATYRVLCRITDNGKEVELNNEDLLHAKDVVAQSVNDEMEFTQTSHQTNSIPNTKWEDLITEINSIKTLVQSQLNSTERITQFIFSKNKNENAVKILRTLANNPEGMSLDEITRISGVSKKSFQLFITRGEGVLLICFDPTVSKYRLIIQEKEYRNKIRRLAQKWEKRRNNISGN